MLLESLQKVRMRGRVQKILKSYVSDRQPGVKLFEINQFGFLSNRIRKAAGLGARTASFSGLHKLYSEVLR